MHVLDAPPRDIPCLALDAPSSPAPLHVMTTSESTLRVAIFGMGGFAGSHHETILRLEAEGDFRLVATCDPHPDAFAQKREDWRFAARGVRVFNDYRALLAACDGALDVVVIATPIPLHAEMHRAAVERGIAVYLEKPPTLDPVELEAMIATDRAAAKATLVGFNFIIERSRLALKRRMLAGEFGALRGVGLLARWPRGHVYYQRNNWAGRLLADDGRLILDSCFANAMAHFSHNVLHWAGSGGLYHWAEPARARAELYRAHPIEGPDTVFSLATTSGDVSIRIALTHACVGPHVQREDIALEKADIHYVSGSHYEIVWHDGRAERADLPHFDALRENHLDYRRYLRGETDRPATRLDDCRPFVGLNALNYISSAEIASFPADTVLRHPDDKNPTNYQLEVAGLASAMDDFVTTGRWPGETRPWPRHAPATLVTPADIPRLENVVRQIRACIRTQPISRSNA